MDDNTFGALTLLADAHHLATLSQIDPESLSAGHPLDYPTHMALCEIHQHHGPDATDDFLTHPSRRAGCSPPPFTG